MRDTLRAERGKVTDSGSLREHHVKAAAGTATYPTRRVQASRRDPTRPWCSSDIRHRTRASRVVVRVSNPQDHRGKV